MDGEEIQKLNKLFIRDVTVCPRCQGKCTITTVTDLHFGERPYTECPKCKSDLVYPWGSLLIYSEEIEMPAVEQYRE